MTPCPNCGALRFSTCATHGAWCVRCERALSCPGCQRGESTVALVLTVLTIFAGVYATCWFVALAGHGG